MNVQLKCRGAAAAIAGFAGILGFCGEASAQFEIEQPEVHRGEAEIEAYGAYYDGLPHLPTSALRQGHELEIYYALTDWWAIEVEAEFTQKRDGDGGYESLKLSEVELQNVFELLPLEGDGVGAAFFLTYGENVINGEDETEVTFGPILKARRGPLSATLNLFPVYEFDIEEREIEDGEVEIEEEPDHWNLDYAWQLKHQTTEHVAFGVEGYGSFKDIASDLPGNQPERHRLGPVVYLSSGEDEDEPHGGRNGSEAEGEGPELELTFGVLFGLNDDTSDVAFKYNAEIEF